MLVLIQRGNRRIWACSFNYQNSPKSLECPVSGRSARETKLSPSFSNWWRALSWDFLVSWFWLETRDTHQSLPKTKQTAWSLKRLLHFTRKQTSLDHARKWENPTRTGQGVAWLRQQFIFSCPAVLFVDFLFSEYLLQFSWKFYLQDNIWLLKMIFTI